VALEKADGCEAGFTSGSRIQMGSDARDRNGYPCNRVQLSIGHCDWATASPPVTVDAGVETTRVLAKRGDDGIE
jgi:hypothetical protein